MKRDELGDRQKFYESQSTSKSFIKGIPLMCRLDGKAFHTFTKGLERPYDVRLSSIMVILTKYLVKITNAKVGYTQSDEITLYLNTNSVNSELFFNGKEFKLYSISGIASSKFYQLITKYLSEKCVDDDLLITPSFDARWFNVPNIDEVVNNFIWRQNDAIRNSISMAAQSVYSHNDLQFKPSNVLQEMLFQKGINWNNYPPFFKHGTFVKRQTVEYKIDDISDLPEKHDYVLNPDLTVKRSLLSEYDVELKKLEYHDRLEFISNNYGRI